MSEEQNIGKSDKAQGTSDKPKDNPEVKKEKNGQSEPKQEATGDENVPSTQPQTSNVEPQTISMEVHKHPHHVMHKKQWPEYLLEFSLLFLAVFLGFIAENIREHRVEEERAAQLARNFYDELKGDSVNFHKVLENRWRKNSALAHLKKYFRDSSLTNCSKTFALNFSYGFATYSPAVFEPTDAILQQLKNSGSLRYFRSDTLQNLTGQLSVNIADLRSRNQIELDFVQRELLPFFIQHNDQQWFDKLGVDSNVFLADILHSYEVSSSEVPFQFKKAADMDRSAASNMVGLYQIIFRGSMLRQYQDYKNLNQRLLETLRKEYHLE